MQDNISIIITMIIFVTLVVIFPLYNLFEREDDMSYVLALKATTNFIDEIKNDGYIDLDNYNNYVNELANTGNSYDIEMEAYRKTLIKQLDTSGNFTGQYIQQYKVDYNDDIFNAMNNGMPNVKGSLLKNNAYLLNKDDQIYVKLKNTNTTMAGAIFNTIVPTSRKDRIVVDYGGIIKNSSWNKVESTVHSFTLKPSTPVVTANGLSGTTFSFETGQPVTFVASSTPSDWWKTITSYVFNFQYGDGTTETQTIAASGTTGTITRSFPAATPSKVNVYAVDSDGQMSATTTITINTITLSPQLTNFRSNPDTVTNNVLVPIAGGNSITFNVDVVAGTVSAYNPIIKYVWSWESGGVVQPDVVTTSPTLTKTFANGVAYVRVYAVNQSGVVSNTVGTAFTIMNNFAQQSISSTGVSTIYSIPIPGATVSAYSFEVQVSPGHNSGGGDWWRVEGLTTTGTWENINPPGPLDSYVSVSNGVYIPLTQLANQKRYTQLKFQYSVASGHLSCLTTNSYIKYSVQYKF